MTFPSRTTSLAATAVAAAASVLAFPFLPKRVATHFNEAGEPDRYSSRAAAAIMLPATMLVIEAVNDRLGGWPGGRDRESQSSGTQARDEAVGWVELALLPPHLAILAGGLGAHVDMNRLQRADLGIMMIGLGNVLPKLPRNGLIGIRTPWTLADPAVWERTHRVAGYLMTVAGLLTIASLPLSDKRAARIPVTAMLGAVGLSTAYSLVTYLQRDHKE